MRRGQMLIGFMLILPALAAAQTTDQATKDLIAKLLARIDSLEARVAQLEGPAAHAAAPAQQRRQLPDPSAGDGRRDARS